MGIANNTLLRRFTSIMKRNIAMNEARKNIFFLSFMTFNSKKKLLPI